MRKLKTLCLAILAVVTLASCNDTSGDFVEQLHTNFQKETAIKACLTLSADSAVSHLFVTGGFQESDHKIDYAMLSTSLFDTLVTHGYGQLVDSLVATTNRMAESCGGQVEPILKSAIDTLTIFNPDLLLEGEDDAITHYFDMLEHAYLKSNIHSPVSIRMNLFNVNAIWTEMLQIYHRYTDIPLNFDLQSYIVESMITAILTEMSAEEKNIRTDIEHRTDDTELFAEYGD